MNFEPFPKVPRLSRQCVITEKLDGTNASIYIEADDGCPSPDVISHAGGWLIRAGSRNRWITPEADNYGFAKWVQANASELLTLGPGHHFGEWWGSGIQRGYELKEKRFSLFNVGRWVQHPMDCKENGSELAPICCHVVPILHKGPFDTWGAQGCIDDLIKNGSHAAPGFMKPEGIVIWHAAANQLFKKTCERDEEGKTQAEKAVKEPRPPKDKATGGRRKAQVPYEGGDRRKV